MGIGAQLAPKKRTKTAAKKTSAGGVSKKRSRSFQTRKRPLSIAERFAQAAPALDSLLKAHWKTHLAEQRIIELQRNVDEWLEREAIQTEAFVGEIDKIEKIISPKRYKGETDREYAKRCVSIAKENGLELDYHYTRIAQLSGLSNRQVYTLWVSPDALVA
jgi:hypothetical protein